MWIRIEQRFGIHDLPVHAVTALKRLGVDPRFLNWVELLRSTQTFKRRNRLLNGPNRGDTGPNRLASHNHGARATLTQATTKPGAMKIKIVPEDKQQRRGRIGNIDGDGSSVDLQADDAHIFSPIFS